MGGRGGGRAPTERALGSPFPPSIFLFLYRWDSQAHAGTSRYIRTAAMASDVPSKCHPSRATWLEAYIGYLVMFLFGHLWDWLDRMCHPRFSQPGYAPLTRDFEDFFTRRMYRRGRDSWNRAIVGVPGRHVDVIDRITDDYNVSFTYLRSTTRCLNLSSYNYLGFSQNDGYCAEESVKTLYSVGQSLCSTRREWGTSAVHRQLEERIAHFVAKEDAIVFGMGFATNSCTIPLLLTGKGDLVISDQLNHSSLITGVRGSHAHVRVFKHNNPKHLEHVIRQSIAEGQPRTGRPWRKILIIVEGIYSMEGEVCALKEILEIKKKYGCYLYLDEAHSIGAMGATGRGVTEHCGVTSADVDIMMGTFTKSFGSVGGYVAGNRAVIDYLRRTGWAHNYATTMSPSCVQQALSALESIIGMHGSDGPLRIKQLHDNANYLRDGLRALGFEILGDKDSPVVPMLVYCPAKLPAVSRFCLENGLAVVVVGFPATPLIESRIRFCVSAAHTREDMDDVLRVMSEAGDLLMLRYLKNRLPQAAKMAAIEEYR